MNKDDYEYLTKEATSGNFQISELNLKKSQNEEQKVEL